MKVRELIDVLQRHDPEAKAVVGHEYAGVLCVSEAQIVDKGVCTADGKKFHSRASRHTAGTRSLLTN